jgi:hypothetical protein
MRRFKPLFIISLSLLFCLCDDPVNPFLDLSESSISIIDRSVKDGDTLNIFSRESILVALILREHLSKYTVSIGGNRLWKQDDSTVDQESYTAEPRKFYFSFNDTGLKQITVSALRNDGSRSSEKISLYVKSPLEQKKISAQAGDSIYLSTPAVKDNVIYNWNLKNGEIVRSAFPAIVYKLENPFVTSTGELYVTDSSSRSPSSIFTLADPQSPFLQYTIISASVSNDTIKTIDRNYKMTIKLSGAKSLKGATVNGQEFTVDKIDSLGIELSASLALPNTGTEVIPLYIEIVDGLERMLSDTVFIQVVDKIQNDIIVSVLEPADLSTVHDSILHIYGVISARSSVASFVFATINGSGEPVSGKLNQNVWSFKLKLVPGVNSIRIELYPDSAKSGTALSSVLHTVQYLPSILFASVNDSVSGDTVFTGNTFFDFQILVTAPFQIRNATINNQPFDFVNSQGVNAFKLTKYLSGLDPQKGIQPADVEITSENGQKFNHVFYLVYDKNVLSNLPLLKIVSPIEDTVFTNDSVVRIYGTIANHLQYGDLYLFSNVNGTYTPLFSKPRADSSWEVMANLNEGWNKVIISVFEDSLHSSISLRNDSIHIKKQSSFYDTVRPVFVMIQRVGEEAPFKDFICDTNLLDLKITVSDNIGVASVIVNDTITATTADSVNYYCSVLLVKNSSGNGIVIRAYDKNGNSDSVEYTIKYNRGPVFSLLPESRILSVDSTYHFKAQAVDPDGDTPVMTVKIDRFSKDTVISIGQDGSFLWKPVMSDTGRRIFTFIATDGVGEKKSTVSMVVVLSQAQSIPVAWKTKPEELKTSFTAGLDTLNFLLVVDSITGKKPFSFSAAIGNSNVSIAPEGAFSARIIWVPEAKDIGLRTLSAVVVDSSGFLDTFAVTLKVASPLPLTVNWKPTTASFAENDEMRMIAATLSGPAPSQITISCSIDWSQSSIGHSDISLSDTSYLLFAPGAVTCSLMVKINDDDEVESDEQFVIQFASMPSYVRPLTGGKFTGTIIDDDNVSFSFLTSGGTASESSGKQRIPIILTRTSQTDVVIDCTVDSSSSARTSDFVLNTKRIIIPANQTTANVEITIINDDIIENDEAVILKLTSQMAKLVPGTITSFTWSIIDDDVNKSEVYFSGPSKVIVNEGDVNGTLLIVNLSQELGVPLVVYYTIASNPTATINNDFTLSPSDSVIFNPGELTKTITVAPINNARYENEESFNLELTSVSNANAAAIGTSSVKEVIIIDNDPFF